MGNFLKFATSTRAKWWWLDKWVSTFPKGQVLLVCSGKYNTKSGSRKHNQYVSSYMYVCILWGPNPHKSDCSSDCLKTIILAIIERCQCIQWIAAWWVWGSVTPDQSEGPCRPLSTAESAYKGYVSISTGQWHNTRRGPGLINQVFFYIVWTDQMNYCWRGSWKNQCDVLKNVMLGNLTYVLTHSLK